MAVQLRYGGFAYDLDGSRSDAAWVEYLDEVLRQVNTSTAPVELGLNLADGRGADVLVQPGVPFAVVAPAEVLFDKSRNSTLM